MVVNYDFPMTILFMGLAHKTICEALNHFRQKTTTFK